MSDRNLPAIPPDAADLSSLEAKAAAWESIWGWAERNGLREYSFLRQERYRPLNGPQMLAQWILDLADGDGDLELEQSLVEALVKL